MKRTRIKSTNSERQKLKRKRNFTGPWDDHDHGQFIKRFGCVGCFLSHFELAYLYAAHMKPRGMGGAGGSWFDLAPLCGPCHKRLDIECGNNPDSFESPTHPHKDLRAVARALADLSYAINGPPLCLRCAVEVDPYQHYCQLHGGKWVSEKDERVEDHWCLDLTTVGRTWTVVHAGCSGDVLIWYANEFQTQNNPNMRPARASDLEILRQGGGKVQEA